MILKPAIRALIIERLKDADVLISHRRYQASYYMAGYALELSLKLKICKIFKFNKGFPEDKLDFQTYQNSYKHQKLLVNTITKVRDIRNHDLNKLLFYSGVEYDIKLNYLNEWNLVVNWDPEMRYSIQKIPKIDAENKLSAIKKIITNIL